MRQTGAKRLASEILRSVSPSRFLKPCPNISALFLTTNKTEVQSIASEREISNVTEPRANTGVANCITFGWVTNPLRF